MDKFMQLSLDIVHPLYATVYLNPWYRLLGVKLGRRAEVSTASSISPDLVELGDECFIADAVILGVPRIADGEIVLERTRAGRRAFVGNSALRIGACTAPCPPSPIATAPGKSKPCASSQRTVFAVRALRKPHLS